jgi:cell wall-associated NlpC family hydrolase
MSFVQRVTSVTLVTVLALAGPAFTGQADAAGKHHQHRHHHHPTAQQRYAKAHPRLVRSVRIAMRQRGDRYRWGADGPRRFDCSGLVYYSYQRAGFRHMPRTSRAQFTWVRRIHRMHMKRGDLMFFHRHGRVYHVAIFLRWKHGHRVMLHAPKPGERVQRDRPWTTHFWAGTVRPKKDVKKHQKKHHHRHR